MNKKYSLLTDGIFVVINLERSIKLCHESVLMILHLYQFLCATSEHLQQGVIYLGPII
jgi:hypothetical protein